jgi:hypothetical protein
MKMNLVAILALCIASSMAIADDNDGAYLDAPYKRPVLEVKARAAARLTKLGQNKNLDRASVRKSDVLAMIANQTPVKAQANRGTCSIFSATAILESMLVIQGRFDSTVDLSEEWLEYVLMRNRTEDGSNSSTNFNTLLTQSTASEDLLPYIGETWETIYSSPLAEERCGTLEGRGLTSCLLAHRNPALFTASDSQLSNPQSPLYDLEFLAARKGAKEFSKNLDGLYRGQYYRTFEEAKELLAQGIPLTLDFDFYYGAWNHRKATELGLTRNMDNWYKGIVGFPEYGSLDRTVSMNEPAGHSVVAVGYDDDVVVTVPVLMADGTTRDFTYKGVIYFKNSWGTTSFGNQFVIESQAKPGYGMMVYKYAEDLGTFYEMPQN